MPTQLAEEAISVLHDLVQRGEIDPWDVQVIDVIDRYLSNIPLNTVPAQDTKGNHLPQSGQAFVWASMLVLLKANTLEAQAEATEEFLEQAELDSDAAPTDQRLKQPESYLHRRPSVPPVRRRRVTLAELIEQIQQMAKVVDQQVPRPRKRRLGYSRREATQQISQLAHDENLNETAAELEALLRDRLSPSTSSHVNAPTDSINQAPPHISLDQLVEWWAEAQAHEASTHDRVGVFWALLLLCSQSKVELQQADFYQSLEITPLI